MKILLSSAMTLFLKWEALSLTWVSATPNLLYQSTRACTTKSDPTSRKEQVLRNYQDRLPEPRRQRTSWNSWRIRRLSEWLDFSSRHEALLRENEDLLSPDFQCSEDTFYRTAARLPPRNSNRRLPQSLSRSLFVLDVHWFRNDQWYRFFHQEAWN